MAAAFCYGRECLVPDLFKQLVTQISQNNLHAPSLIWYLERHIILDGDSHGPLAERMVQELCENDPRRIQAVEAMKCRVVDQRNNFWVSIAETLPTSSAQLAYC